jgi:bacteriorhodopsin
VENQEAYQKTKKGVETRRDFYIHLAVYVCVNIVLIVINLATSSDYLWFKWPLLGWGIGLFFHALAVFVFSRGSTVREQMSEEGVKQESPAER